MLLDITHVMPNLKNATIITRHILNHADPQALRALEESKDWCKMQQGLVNNVLAFLHDIRRPEDLCVDHVPRVLKPPTKRAQQEGLPTSCPKRSKPSDKADQPDKPKSNKADQPDKSNNSDSRKKTTKTPTKSKKHS